jgi:hypothetical protein
VAIVLIGVFLFVVGPSVVFDLAYDRAMQQKDAREALREDLQGFIGESSAIIGIARLGSYFYTSMPAAEPLKSDRVSVQLQDPANKADFFVLGFPRQMNRSYVEATIRAVEAQGHFKFEKSYSVPLTIFGYEFRLVRFPPDMTYPFPTILLFRARTPT